MQDRKFIVTILLLGLLLFLANGCSNHGNQEVKPSTSSAPPSSIAIDVATSGIKLIKFDQIGLSDLESGEENIPPFHLSQAGKSIPYYLSDLGLLFFGRAPTSRYATQRTYILDFDRAGERMETVSLPSNELPRISSINRSIHFEENLLYDSSASDFTKSSESKEFEPWFWETVQVNSLVELEIELPDEPLDMNELSLALWGVTKNTLIDNDHDLDVFVNGEFVEQIRWDGQRYFTGTLSLDNTILKKGLNRITFDNNVDGATPVDISRIDWIETAYRAKPVAIDDQLLIQDIYGSLTASGFSGPPLVFEISDQDNPKILTGWELESDSITLSIEDGMEVLIVGPNSLLTSSSLDVVGSNDLRSNDIQADMLIVTTEELSAPLEPLIKAREAQSLTVRLATLEEIYHSFGDGQNGPVSISEFVRYASENWAEPKPKYLFLIGEATYDYQQHLDGGPTNVVPAPMVPVLYSGETVSDSQLADIDGDNSPDLAVGRWPVDDPKDVKTLVERTLSYEEEAISDRSIFVADGSSVEFSNLNEAIINDSGFSTGEVNQLIGGNDEDLIESWNQGAWLVTYAGHGSLDLWGKQGVLNQTVVKDLGSTSSPPIVLQLTCLTGYFAHPTLQSLSETLLLEDNGPVLLIAATSLTLSNNQQPFGTNLLRKLHSPEVIRIGDAFLQAKTELDLNSNPHLREIIDTFGLLGDPTTIIARPDTS